MVSNLNNRLPLYKNHLSKNFIIRTNSPVLSNHLTIKAKNFWPNGDRYTDRFYCIVCMCVYICGLVTQWRIAKNIQIFYFGNLMVE